MSRLGCLACCFAMMATAARAAVIGIDFGARFLKVGIIQPGKGIELVLNEATKRKSSSAAGFNNQNERVYGDESYNLIGKIPHKQFIFSKLLLGKNISSAEVAAFKAYGFPYELESDADTGSVVTKYGTNSTFRAEELVAFVLSYAKQMAEAHAGSPVKDAVITVPPHFKESERAAMLSAAEIAGLHVLSLMHENTAFAFKFGFDKESEFSPTEPTNVVFYDMGASSYKVSLVSFSTTVGKKNKTTGSMTVKGVAWDDALGGRDFDQIVLDMLLDEFVKQYPKLEDCRKSFRVMGKLRKEAERVKDVLSANQQFQVAIEAVYEDRDLRMVINRAAFEERAAGLFARLSAPIDRMLLQANMSKADVHRVEIVGGATRIPKVKETAAEYFGIKTSASLNGDEAAAFGSTLYAAKLSTSFRLRDFNIVDSFPHPVVVKLGSDAEPAVADSEDGEEKPSKGKDKVLFKGGSKFPHKKLITMSRTEDLMVALSYLDPAGDTKEPISNFNVSGVSAALARLSTPLREPTAKPKVSVTFALTSSGIVEVSKAEVALEMLETYDDYEVVPLNETDTNATDAVELDAAAGDADSAAAESEAAETAVGDDINTTVANATNTTAPLTKTIKVTKQRKRMHYATLKVATIVMGSVTPLNSTHIATCIAANKALLEAERVRKVNAEAKNQLESFIINTRDKLSSDDVMEEVSSEEERDTLRTEFETMEDWLYEEGMEVEAKVYDKKKKGLEKMAAPIFLRAAEKEARPRVVSQALDAVNWTSNILQTWATDRPEVTEEERNTVSEMCANFTTWLDEVEAKQAELQPFETPAFLSSEVTSKLEPIEKEVRRLIKKPKPKPPKVKASKNSTSTNSTTANSSTTEGGNTTGGDDLPSHDEL